MKSGIFDYDSLLIIKVEVRTKPNELTTEIELKKSKFNMFRGMMPPFKSRSLGLVLRCNVL